MSNYAKKARKLVGITQDEMASLLEVSRSTVNRIETGKAVSVEYELQYRDIIIEGLFCSIVEYE
jgi:DNA-binding XRE family transcriptional regulator